MIHFLPFPGNTSSINFLGFYGASRKGGRRLSFHLLIGWPIATLNFDWFIEKYSDLCWVSHGLNNGKRGVGHPYSQVRNKCWPMNAFVSSSNLVIPANHEAANLQKRKSTRKKIRTLIACLSLLGIQILSFHSGSCLRFRIWVDLSYFQSFSLSLVFQSFPGF